MRLQRGDHLGHFGKVERPRQMENPGDIGDRRRGVKIIRLLVHAPHQQRPIGVAAKQQRRVDHVRPFDARLMRRPRLAQCIDRAERQRLGENLARLDVEFLETLAHALAALRRQIEPLDGLRPEL